jgi:hypothetical protein
VLEDELPASLQGTWPVKETPGGKKLMKKVEAIVWSDLKVGDKWVPSIDRIDATLDDRKKYFENNRSPGLEPPKKEKESPKKNSKSLN